MRNKPGHSGVFSLCPMRIIASPLDYRQPGVSFLIGKQSIIARSTIHACEVPVGRVFSHMSQSRAERSPVFENVQAGSWWNQMWMVLLQPARSFRLFSAVPDARQWVWMALIILILTGVSAARGGSVAQETANPVELAPSEPGAVPSDPFGG